LNPGRRGGKPATNRLSYGAALYGFTESAFFPLLLMIPRSYLSFVTPAVIESAIPVFEREVTF
jgi:hypothetical protein